MYISTLQTTTATIITEFSYRLSDLWLFSFVSRVEYQIIQSFSTDETCYFLILTLIFIRLKISITSFKYITTKHQNITMKERKREMFYLTTHSTHFIYGYMASDIWLRTILIVRKETRCCHIGYSYRLTARVLLYAPSHRQDNTYHSLCYTSRGALAGTT